MRILFVLGLLTVLISCGGRSVRAPVPPETNAIESTFLDLKPGWRLVVIMPILKSGGYLLSSLQGQDNVPLNQLSAGPDFLGYETDTYSVTGNGPVVRIEFRSAKVVKDGKNHREKNFHLALFETTTGMPCIRLIYLVRVSQTDHNMAVVAATDANALSAITQMVEANPDECKAGPLGSCAWVPAGIAVRPEERRVVDGVKQWAAVR